MTKPNKHESWSIVMFLFALSVVGWAIGCAQPIEVTARDAIAASKGYIASASQRHTAECIQSGGQAEYCQIIVQAAYAENAAVTALETYCQIPAHMLDTPDKKCQPVKSAEPALVAALKNLNSLAGELKKAAGQ